tara:strand:- start:19 stop:1230 length:1212 start_codon:yes stop_codon:yes gene_type:complete
VNTHILPTLENNSNSNRTELTETTTLTPGSYSLFFPTGAFSDAFDNITTEASTFAFTINYIPPYFSEQLPDISSTPLLTIIDLSSNIKFPPFTIDDLRMAITPESPNGEYILNAEYDVNGKVIIELETAINSVSKIDHPTIVVPLSFNFIYASTSVDIVENLTIEIVYKNPVITPPSSLTIYKQYGSILTYSIAHLDTLFSDISFSITTPNTYKGTITPTLTNNTAEQPSTINYTVTVQNVDGSNKYFIDGQQQYTLTLFEGNTYIFDWSSVSSHPFMFSTVPDDLSNVGEYTTGVTIDRTAYTTTVVLNSSAPTLYYHCELHSGMGGQANTLNASYYSSLSLEFSLNETDKNNTEVTINVFDTQENTTTTSINTVVFSVPYSNTILSTSTLNVTYNLDETQT